MPKDQENQGLIYGRALTGFDAEGQPIFSNTGASDNVRIVSEIHLRKVPDDDICNFCLQSHPGALTEDHVPPACTGNRTLMRYRNAMNDTLAGSGPTLGLAQGGIKFKTVCRTCHDKLGDYDQAIAEMFRIFSMTNWRKPSMAVCLSLRPSAIIRGIAGHFMSAKTTHARGGLDETLAAIVSPLSPIPQNIHFYVAPYFDPEIKILREMMLAAPPSTFVMMYVLKVFPYAFVITDKDIFKNVPRWNRYYDLPVGERANVELFSIAPCPLHWPENANYHQAAIVFGRGMAESIIANPERTI